MYLLEDYLIAHRPGDATDLRGKQILGVYQQRYVKNSSNTSVSDKQTLYLEPRFECLSGGSGHGRTNDAVFSWPCRVSDDRT